MTKTSVRIGSSIASNTWKNLASKMSSTDEDEVKENLVEEAYQYLRRKSYPAGASEGRKRCIRRKAAKFILMSNVLGVPRGARLYTAGYAKQSFLHSAVSAF